MYAYTVMYVSVFAVWNGEITAFLLCALLKDGKSDNA